MSNREEFEEAAARLGYNLTMAEHETGEYHYPVTQDAWWMWQESYEQAARARVVPNERGKNRYGLDMAYFRELFNRELSRPLVDFRPDELARVLARAARTADAAVLQEPEFQPAQQGSVPESIEVAIDMLEDYVRALGNGDLDGAGHSTTSCIHEVIDQLATAL